MHRFSNEDMNENVLSTAMHQATHLVREQNVIEATRVVQRALSGRGHALPRGEQSLESSRLIELQTNVAESSGGFEQPRQDARIAGERDAAAKRHPAARMKRPLGEVLKLCVRPIFRAFGLDSAPLVKPRKAPPVPVPVPDGAAYLSRTFACEAGSFLSFFVYASQCAAVRAELFRSRCHHAFPASLGATGLRSELTLTGGSKVPPFSQQIPLR
jgi:hypothetical protein